MDRRNGCLAFKCNSYDTSVQHVVNEIGEDDIEVQHFQLAAARCFGTFLPPLQCDLRAFLNVLLSLNITYSRTSYPAPS